MITLKYDISAEKTISKYIKTKFINKIPNCYGIYTTYITICGFISKKEI